MGQVIDSLITDRYALYNGDAMEVMPDLPDGFAHGVIYSPPFANPSGNSGINSIASPQYRAYRSVITWSAIRPTAGPPHPCRR